MGRFLNKFVRNDLKVASVLQLVLFIKLEGLGPGSAEVAEIDWPKVFDGGRRKRGVKSRTFSPHLFRIQDALQARAADTADIFLLAPGNSANGMCSPSLLNRDTEDFADQRVNRKPGTTRVNGRVRW